MAALFIFQGTAGFADPVLPEPVTGVDRGPSGSVSGEAGVLLPTGNK